jgi:hypothetical protein
MEMRVTGQSLGSIFISPNAVKSENLVSHDAHSPRHGPRQVSRPDGQPLELMRPRKRSGAWKGGLVIFVLTN